MDPSSTSSGNTQQLTYNVHQRHSGTRQFKPLQFEDGVRRYVYEAPRILLHTIPSPKQVTTVRLTDSEAQLFEQMPSLASQQVWDTAFERFQAVRNNVLIEQLRLYGIRSVRSLLLTAHLDHSQTTLASVVLGDVERWAFYDIYRKDTEFLEKLASAKVSRVAHPSCAYDVRVLAEQHGRLLNSYPFNPTKKTRGPKTHVGLFYRYALHTCFGSTNFKPSGKLSYPAGDTWETDPFVEAFPDACDPDVNAGYEAQFEASLRGLAESQHEKARAQWLTPTWEQLTMEYNVCLQFHRPKLNESFVSGAGVALLFADTFPLEPMPTPPGLRRRRRKPPAARIASEALVAPAVTPQPDTVEEPGGLALARSPSTPPPPLPESAQSPRTPNVDAEAMLRDIFSTLEA